MKGEILELKNTINTMVDQLNGFASEVTRVAREVGTEGRLGVQAAVPGVAGTWKDLTDSVNVMGANLTAQVRNIAEVTTAVARGDLSRKITVDVKGEILELKNTINTMVDQLRAFAAEVTRVAREVGTEGRLGGQAEVPGVAGTWKDLTDSVNVMAANLTDQVRGIVKVVTAVADGNLRQKLTVEAKGEVAALAETINNVTDTLATFAEQVTNVAREVGVEGRLGGQANVPGAAGTWKDLTGNVNLLAANLTNQVRAIAEVATAVTKGDLTRSIQVEARGEVAELKDNINTMIDNLRATTDRNQEQDWLKTNLAKFTRMLQGQRDLVTVGKLLLSELAPLVNARQGTVYQMLSDAPDSAPALSLLAGYAVGDDQSKRIQVGQGLVGQCALDKQRILLTKVPPGYTRVHSSLGSAKPKNIVVLPVLFEGETKAVIELSALQPFTATHLTFLEQLTQSIGVVLNTIEATMRTENLLQQSQELTIELQTRQTELQQTNEQLALKAQQLAEQNVEVERKNNEVEQARRALEEKAAELALTSKYKSEFLANMSHELRTPLNSILILGQQLAENPSGNLASKQVDFARNIHSAGTDLLTLINDILDLSKIESGTVTVEPEAITFRSLRDSVERTFHHVAESKNLTFQVEIDATLPRTFTSDAKRLQQILKNLLSNAFKFTAQGQVKMRVEQVATGMVGGASGAPLRADGDRHRGVGHRNRHRPGKAAADLRGVPAGRRRHEPQVRRHGPRPGDQPRAGDAARRRDSPRQRARPGKHVHAVPAALVHRSGAGGHRPGPRIPADRRPDQTDFLRCQSSRWRRRRSSWTIAMPSSRATTSCSSSTTIRTTPGSCSAWRATGASRELSPTRGTTALTLARQYLPTAITLDVFLPDMLGWTVLNSLKLDPATRHIPVQILSVEEERQHGLAHGAFSYLVKPGTTEDLESAFDRITSYVAPHKKRLLVVEDNDIERAGIVELLTHDDIKVVCRRDRRRGPRCHAPNGRRASRLLRHGSTAAGHDRIRAPQSDAGRADAARYAGCRVHRQRTEQRRGGATEDARQERGPQGRAFARASLRRDGALPPPRRGQPAGTETAAARAAARLECRPARQAGPRRRRRCPQHLRAHERARESGDGGPDGDQRPPGDRPGQQDAGPERGADGHHDAGDGWLRDDARDPQQPGLPDAADPRADREGHEGRSGEVSAGGRLGLHRQAGQHRPAALAPSRVVVSLNRGDRMSEDVKILIVDDEPRNLDALEVMLASSGCALVRAHSADEALLAMLQHEFAAMIFDIRMPSMGGIELANLVKQRRRTQDVPIIFLTAHTLEDEDVLRAYGVGAVDYLIKPVNAAILCSKVSVFIDLFRKTRALAILNQELQREVSARQKVQEALQQVNQELELRVAERTAALTVAHRGVKENEERLRMAMDVAEIAAWEWDVTGGRMTWSTDPETLFGFPAGWFGEDRRVFSTVHPDDQERLRECVQSAMSAGSTYECEYRLARPDGVVVWITERGRVLHGEHGRVEKIVGREPGHQRPTARGTGA